MKKLLILLFALPSFLFAQETTIGNLPQVTSINATDAMVLEQTDSTRKMLISDLLGEITQYDSAYIYFRVDSLGTVVSELSVTDLTGTANRLFVADAFGAVAEIDFGSDGQVLTSNGAILAPSFEDATGGSGTDNTISGNDYITLSGQEIVVGDVDLTTDVTGELDTTNIDMSQLDAKYSLAEDTIVVDYRDGLTATESTGGDSVYIDVDGVTVDMISATGTPSSSTYLDGSGAWSTPSGGSAELDSATMWFKDEIYPLFNFSAGNKNERDTAIFESGSILGSWFNRSPDTLVVTSIVPSIVGGVNDSLQFQIMYNDTLGSTSAEMVPIMESAPMELGTDADGYSPRTEYTTIVNDTIPPNMWVWSQVVAVDVTEKPYYFGATVSGYRVKGTYDDNLWASGVPEVLTNTDSTLFYSFVSTDNIETDGEDSATQWTDLSGNDNHLLADDETGEAPYYEPGSDSLSFDGVANTMYKSIALADQPVTIYAVVRMNSYTLNQVFFGGANTGSNLSASTSNRYKAYSGAVLFSTNDAVPYGQWHILRYTINSTNSKIKVDATTVGDGDAGTNDWNGLAIANEGSTNSVYGHMAVKAVVASVATSAETETEIYNYLKGKYID